MKVAVKWKFPASRGNGTVPTGAQVSLAVSVDDSWSGGQQVRGAERPSVDRTPGCITAVAETPSEWHSRFSENLAVGLLTDWFCLCTLVSTDVTNMWLFAIWKSTTNAIIFFKYCKIQFSRFVSLFWSWVVCFRMRPKYLPILFHVFVGMHVHTCTCTVCRLNLFHCCCYILSLLDALYYLSYQFYFAGFDKITFSLPLLFLHSFLLPLYMRSIPQMENTYIFKTSVDLWDCAKFQIKL